MSTHFDVPLIYYSLYVIVIYNYLYSFYTVVSYGNFCKTLALLDKKNYQIIIKCVIFVYEKRKIQIFGHKTRKYLKKYLKSSLSSTQKSHKMISKLTYVVKFMTGATTLFSFFMSIYLSGGSKAERGFFNKAFTVRFSTTFS